VRPLIIDDGDPAPGYTQSGPGLTVTHLDGAFMDNRVSDANSGNTATWTFSGLDEGPYLVSATWIQHYNRASNAPYRINGGSAIRVNQRARPRDFMANGARWEILGQAAVTTAGGSITVSLSAGTNGIVIADAVRIVPVSERVLHRPGELAVIDNGDPGVGGDSNGISTWEGHPAIARRELQWPGRDADR
jgi:hypothetical protein